jgi:hypothetical protein
MKTYGIRILDGRREVLLPVLKDLLEVIDNGDSYSWCILFLDGTPAPREGGFLVEYKNKVNKSENGLLIPWEELLNLSTKFFQMFEITVLGDKNTRALHRYKNEADMYSSCYVAIDLIDCAFWEVYTKDLKIINRLKLKFREIELLNLK